MADLAAQLQAERQRSAELVKQGELYLERAITAETALAQAEQELEGLRAGRRAARAPETGRAATHDEALALARRVMAGEVRYFPPQIKLVAAALLAEHDQTETERKSATDRSGTGGAS